MRRGWRAESPTSFLSAQGVPAVPTGECPGASPDESRGVRLLTLATLFGLFLAGVAFGQTFTEFTIPTSASSPTGITSGPDGNLWFTENSAVSGNKIGRITTAGVFTEFTIPTGACLPYGITAGPDGNLWFAESANQQNRTDHHRRRLHRVHGPRPITAARPSIASGPDGNLWFTEANSNKIGQITTSGVVTEFTVPTANFEPYGIAAGPDGNLWFTELQGNKIGRITTAGVITEFSDPHGQQRPGDDRGRPGRQPLVHGGRRRQDRADHDGGRRHRIHHRPHCQQRALMASRPVPTATSGSRRRANRIGRITTAGVVTEFTIGTTPTGRHGHHRRPGRQHLVRRVQRPQDRADHHGRRRLAADDREVSSARRRSH